MVIITFQNDGVWTEALASYAVRVSVNGNIIHRATVKDHVRGDWRRLVAQWVGEAGIVEREEMVTTHKHELAPAYYGGVCCMSCELDLDADETAAAFQALLEACEAVLVCEANLASSFSRCRICGVLKTASHNHRPWCPVPRAQSAIAQAEGEAKP